MIASSLNLRLSKLRRKSCQLTKLVMMLFHTWPIQSPEMVILLSEVRYFILGLDLELILLRTKNTSTLSGFFLVSGFLVPNLKFMLKKKESIQLVATANFALIMIFKFKFSFSLFVFSSNTSYWIHGMSLQLLVYLCLN